MNDVRYIAEWPSGVDPHGPDIYGQTECRSMTSAKRTAVRIAKREGIAEWAAAEKQERGPYGWVTVERWVGDWQGNWIRQDV